jgi:hypothetical protein
VSPRAARPGAGLAIACVFGAALIFWAALIWASIRNKPGWEGILTGVFAGGFLALLIVLGGLSLVVSVFVRGYSSRPAQPELAAVHGDLAQTLAELEVVRKRTITQINLSALWRVPICLALAYVAWKVTRKPGDDPSEILGFLLVGAFAGYSWAANRLERAYRRLYKQRVLPRLASQFGALEWRPARPPLDDFRRHRLFPEWDDCQSEDEIAGEYRGLPLSVMELRLTKGSGDDEKTIFHGIAAAVTLPRGLRGVTVVAPDRGVFGNFAERLRGGPCQPVRLEDPAFEKAFEVYATDQVAARALLTPAFMERFLAFAQSGRFGAPVALVQDNRLLMALSVGGGRNLFEPPSYLKPAAARDALAQLTRDLEAVLRAADAVIELDFAAKRAAAPTP